MRVIDVEHLGRQHVIGCWEVDGVLIDPGPESSLPTLLAGKLPLIPLPDLGVCMSHVEDIAGGILLALDRGRPGETYVISAPATTMREAVETVARVAGRKPPKYAVPTPLLKAMIPIGPLVGKLMNQPPNLREMISSADKVTFWASHEKATRELGYEPRGLEQGLREMLEVEGRIPAASAA